MTTKLTTTRRQFLHDALTVTAALAVTRIACSFQRKASGSPGPPAAMRDASNVSAAGRIASLCRSARYAFGELSHSVPAEGAADLSR